MKVYIVTKHWTDWDGWPKGSDLVEGAYLDKVKATAHARSIDSPLLGGDFTVGSVKEVEVLDA